MNDHSSTIRRSLDIRSTNEPTCTSASSTTTVSRTKTQPVRVKALLSFYEDEDEGETKDSNSDADDAVPIPEDEEENNLDESFLNETLNMSEGTYNQNAEKLEQLDNDENQDKIQKNKAEASIFCSRKSDEKSDFPQNLKDVETEPVTMEFTNNMQWNIDDINYSKNKDIDHCEIKENKENKQPICTENEKVLSNESSISRDKREIKTQQEFHKNPSSILEFVHVSESNVIPPQSTVFDTPCSMVKREFNSAIEKNMQIASDSQLSVASNHKVTDTPMKHIPENAVTHPHPSLAHRNIFRTPQNKLQNDLPKYQNQTPASILHQWPHNSIRQTPSQNKAETVLEYTRTPSTVPFNLKRETPRYSNPDNKNIRRPLADAMLPAQQNNEFRVLHESQLSKVDEVKQENKNMKKPIESIDEHKDNTAVKSLNTNFMHLPKSTIGESQEIRHPNDGANQKTSDHNRIFENRQISCNAFPSSSSNKTEMENRQINSNMYQNVPSSSSNKTEMENRQINSNMYQNVPSSSSDKTDMESIISKPKYNDNYKENNMNFKSNPQCKTETDGSACSKSKPNEQKSRQNIFDKNVQQEVRQVVDQMANVQFSVPCISKVKQNRTITVKKKEYLILGSLGRGMSGEVFRVQDLSTSELRAIKCVNLSCMDEESAQGCLDEISMLHKLQAPCVIKMFDFEIKSPMVYVVMEMGDTDLSRLLKSMLQEKQLPLSMVLYYWTEMLTAVKHIHDNDVIHSDLKPANFLLVRGRLKLIDFGIASSMNADMTSVVKNCPIGTLNYISPEALMDISGSTDSPDRKNNKYKISFKSDVWSLGCILYSMLYGHTPFQHIRSQWAKINAIINPKPNISFPVMSSSTEGGSKLPDPPPLILIDVIRKCLQHDPKSRPTVAQLLQIEYIPRKPSPTPNPTPQIPANILVKIKSALNDDEWRHVIQALENKRQT